MGSRWGGGFGSISPGSEEEVIVGVLSMRSNLAPGITVKIELDSIVQIIRLTRVECRKNKSSFCHQTSQTSPK